MQSTVQSHNLASVAGQRTSIISLVLTIAFVSGVIATRQAQAQTLSTYKLSQFFAFRAKRGARGDQPNGGLFRDSAGNLYGTTYVGGDINSSFCGAHKSARPGCGVAYKVDPSGKETVLHKFSGKKDGNAPWGPLVADQAGNAYGGTAAGGYLDCAPPLFGGSGCGVVYKVDPTGKQTILHRFKDGADGAFPADGGSLILDAQGNLYGNTVFGGDLAGCALGQGYGCGVVFKVDPTGKYSVLYAFKGKNDGAGGYGLSMDATGNLYGVTVAGGDLNCYTSEGCGTVYRLSPTSKGWQLKTLHVFKGPEGWYPEGAPLVDSNGNLYGTTFYGGDLNCAVGGGFGCGVVYKIDQNGEFTLLHTFKGKPDGAIPSDVNLSMDSTGNVYGTTWQGGYGCEDFPNYGCGTVFEIDKNGKETVVHALRGLENGEGDAPTGGVVIDPAGNLYGEVALGGTKVCIGDGCGMIFKLSPR
jgi:uncharacterized repeat protein (TIGR03803 family)